MCIENDNRERGKAMSNFNGMERSQWVAARRAIVEKYKDQGGHLVCVNPDSSVSIRVESEYSETGTHRIDAGHIKDYV